MAAELEASSQSTVSYLSESQTPPKAGKRYLRILPPGKKKESAGKPNVPERENADPTGPVSEELAACRSCGGQCMGMGLCRAVVELATDWMQDFVFLCLCRQFQQQNTDQFERSRNTMEALLQGGKKMEHQQMRTVYLCQFLSRIAEGRNLDAQFEKDERITPLEAALLIWETIDREPGKFGTLHEEIQLLVQIQAVAVCMERGSYKQATEVLERIFGDSDSNESMKLKLDAIISKKDPYNEFLKGFTYKRMLKKINCFIDIILSERSTDFLCKAATKVVEAERIASISKSDENGNDVDMETAVKIEKRLGTGPISAPSLNENMAINENEETRFYEREDGRYLKKRSRMPHVHPTKEASSVEKFPTIEDRLSAHKQLFTEKRDKEHSQDSQSSLKMLTAHRRKDQSSLSVIRKPTSTSSKKSSSSTDLSPQKRRRQYWLPQEDDQLRKGVKKCGVGNWKEIIKRYKFNNRTGVMIKDRWRTLQKQEIFD